MHPQVLNEGHPEIRNVRTALANGNLPCLRHVVGHAHRNTAPMAPDRQRAGHAQAGRRRPRQRQADRRGMGRWGWSGQVLAVERSSRAPWCNPGLPCASFSASQVGGRGTALPFGFNARASLPRTLGATSMGLPLGGHPSHPLPRQTGRPRPKTEVGRPRPRDRTPWEPSYEQNSSTIL